MTPYGNCHLGILGDNPDKNNWEIIFQQDGALVYYHSAVRPCQEEKYHDRLNGQLGHQTSHH